MHRKNSYCEHNEQTVLFSALQHILNFSHTCKKYVKDPFVDILYSALAETPPSAVRPLSGPRRPRPLPPLLGGVPGARGGGGQGGGDPRRRPLALEGGGRRRRGRGQIGVGLPQRLENTSILTPPFVNIDGLCFPFQTSGSSPASATPCRTSSCSAGKGWPQTEETRQRSPRCPSWWPRC